MYVYVYDAFASESKYHTTIARIETRITDLGIAGKIIRLSPLTSAEESVNDAIKKGAETIVAVGNDETVNRILPVVAEHDVSFGYIPIGSKTRIAQLLGIPLGEKACDVLSARVVERLDLGQVNERFFLNQLELPPSDTIKIVINGQYTVRSLSPEQAVVIYNLSPDDVEAGDPRDGLLEIVFGSDKKGVFRKDHQTSVFTAKKVEIQGSDAQVIADGQSAVAMPVNVAVAHHRLKMIVGKNRAFT